jgi:hypothetical protein
MAAKAMIRNGDMKTEIIAETWGILGENAMAGEILERLGMEGCLSDDGGGESAKGPIRQRVRSSVDVKGGGR